MDIVVDFIPFVRREFADFAERHGMQERQGSDTMVYRSVLFVGEGAYIRFSLDVRDGYLDVYYGDASNLDIYGNIDEALPPSAWAGSGNALLKADGGLIPASREELCRTGRLAEALRALVASLERHERIVFGNQV